MMQHIVGDHHAGTHPGGVAAVQGMGAFVHVAHKADAAVSYTHLDVYKRQGQVCAVCGQRRLSRP